MGYDIVALTRREGEKAPDCIERYLSGVIANRLEVKKAFPSSRAVPYNINHQALALWLVVEKDGGSLGECLFVEYWPYGSLGVMIEWCSIPEDHLVHEVPPADCLDYLDSQGMPRSWPVSLAQRVRTWRDGMARLTAVS